MKIYISVDMEGIAGITNWDEATDTHPAYKQFQVLMTREVIAACEGAHAAGAQEIYVRDAHWTGRNLLLEDLPTYVTLIRDWSDSPMGGLQELDETFDAILLIGWHARAGSEQSPLAHTITTRIQEVHINGSPVSEFGIYAYLAEYRKVPIAFVSGDACVCEEVKVYNPSIAALAVSKGVGASTISMTPQAARKRIYEEVKQALQGNLAACRKTLPQSFEILVTYNTPNHAYKFSWYPGATHAGERSIKFTSSDFFEIKRFLQFVTQ